jgi:hypothetical protein
VGGENERQIGRWFWGDRTVTPKTGDRTVTRFRVEGNGTVTPDPEETEHRSEPRFVGASGCPRCPLRARREGRKSSLSEIL